MSYIVVRHGARTPVTGKYMTYGIKSFEEETNLWRNLLPCREEIFDLFRRHPPKHEQGFAYRRPRDAHAWPYGALTRKGLDSAKELKLSSNILRSTNYRRTMLTAAAAVQPASVLMENDCTNKNQEESDVLHIEINGIQCGLNGFDASPIETMSALNETAKNICEPPELKKALIHAIPGATQESFGWLQAVDYAECRIFHDLPFYDQELLDAARKHLRSRYIQIFQNPVISTLVAAPAIAEIRRGLSSIEASSASLVNVAHDVTIIALLHGLDARLPKSFALPPFLSIFEIKLHEASATISVTLNNNPILIGNNYCPLTNIKVNDFRRYLDHRLIILQQKSFSLDTKIPIAHHEDSIATTAQNQQEQQQHPSFLTSPTGISHSASVVAATAT